MESGQLLAGLQRENRAWKLRETTIKELLPL